MTSHYPPPLPHHKAKWRFGIWITSVLFVFYKYILEVSPSIMTRDLSTALHIDAAMLGHIAASYYYAYTIMQVPSGLLIDKFGPRNITTLGILLCSFGAYLFSICDGPLLASSARFIIGVGATFAVLNTFKVSSNWFAPKRFALLSGLMITLGTLGAVFGQAPLAIFLKISGWRDGIATLSMVGFIFAGIFYLLVRDKPPHVAYDTTPIVNSKIPLHHALYQSLKKSQTWILSVYSGLAFAPILAFGGLWGISFLETKYTCSHEIAAFLTSLIFVGFALGSPLLCNLSTWIGKRKPIMVYGTLIALALLTLILYVSIPNKLVIGTLLFLFGFSLSGFLLSFTVIHEINIPIMTASVIGIMNTLNGFFGAITDPLIGFMLDLRASHKESFGLDFNVSDYQIALSFLPAYLIICLLLLLFIKETHCKQKLD